MTMLLVVFIAAGALETEKAANEVQRVVDAALDAPVKECKFSGVALVAKDGELLVQIPYGRLDWTTKSKMTVDVGLMIFSVTKQFTATAILRLPDRGLLKTSDPVSNYVDHWPKEWESVKLQHLLSHTAGIDIDTQYFWLVKHHPRIWEDPKQTPPTYEPKPLLKSRANSSATATPGIPCFRWSLSACEKNCSATPYKRKCSARALLANCDSPFGAEFAVDFFAKVEAAIEHSDQMRKTP